MEESRLGGRVGEAAGGSRSECRSVVIATSDGARLVGTLYTPPNHADHGAAIVMSHGFAALAAHFLWRFAEAFAAAGFAVLVYDHRNFGGSSGEPRHEIDPWQQIRDARDVITWLSLQPGVNSDRIGLWGSSYSGGHALVLGAIDRRIACVVAQVPTISGYQQSLRRVRPDAIAAARALQL
ncbi:alpha/beta fold hydrolase [Xanthobacter sp. VTT E-85237]